ncbi:MAG TPA: MBL fold metallo-hydrolase [Bryobacteraceae bacterium]|nr:MBL fold metallo-hydrolase [Bryobacteraceae bacterium]
MACVTVGDFEIAHIQAGVYWWDGGAIFGVVPKVLWGKKTAADESNRIALAFNCYLIRTGGHTILVETGGGDKMDARSRERMKLPPAAEPLPAVIARHGFDPESIDLVVNSHLHWDHCGGNTILTGGDASLPAAPAFPRARYFASRAEWEHAHERLLRDSVSYIDSNYDPLVDAGRMTLVEGEHEIAPGVWMRHAPGHNRDMMVITAASGGQTFCFFSDLVPTAAHVQPTWVAAFDLYPLVTIESKLRWLAAAAEGNWICGFAHDTELGFARIAVDPRTRFAASAVAAR